MKKSQRSTASRLGPIILAFAGVVVLALAIGIVVLDSDDSEPGSSSNNTASNVQDEQGIPYPEVPRVSVADAKSRYDADTAIFVDVRSADEYDSAHIPGAVSLPLAELQARYQELPSDALIFLYCT